MDVKIGVEELRKRKVFVATPMYGGMCSGMYTKATADLATMATKYSMDVKFFYLFNESLVQRARNYLVDEFIRSHYTHLMFIDADIHFRPDDVLSLAALCDDDHPIIGGPYPKKTIAWEKVRNAVDGGLADEAPSELAKYTGDFVFNPAHGQSQVKIQEPTEVLEIGTGFMMIQRRCFEAFEEAYPQFKYTPDHNRSDHFKGDRDIMAYFDTVIDSEAYLGSISNKSNRYLSEDYFFCQMMIKIGFKIWMCPWMNVAHLGNYVFDGTFSALADLPYASHGLDAQTRPQLEERLKKWVDKKKEMEDKEEWAVDDQQLIEREKDRKERRKKNRSRRTKKLDNGDKT